MPLFKTATWESNSATDSVCKQLFKETSKKKSKQSGKSKEEPLHSPIKKALKEKHILKNKLKKNANLLTDVTQNANVTNNKPKRIVKDKKVSEIKSTSSSKQNDNFKKSKKSGSTVAIKKINESKKTISNKTMKQIKNQELKSSKKHKKNEKSNKSLKDSNLIIKKVHENAKKDASKNEKIQLNRNQLKKAVKSDVKQLKELTTTSKEIEMGSKKKKKLKAVENVKSTTKKAFQPSESVTDKTLKTDSVKQKRLKKKEKLKQKLKEIASSKENSTVAIRKPKKEETLREKMLNRLKASKFRYLNEQLYSSTSNEAKTIFKNEPDTFALYHEGYKLQVEKWPLNPLDTIIKSIKKMPKTHVIADFGCGEAKLAKSVPHKVHSFDLVAANESVIECDISHVPLEDNSVDVVVCCLSLMGTNLTDYLLEANRVLKIGGTLKIAEIESRFDIVQDFIDGLKYYGFRNLWKDLSHNLFYFLDFKKESTIKKKKNLPSISLNPCVYKKR